MMCMYYATLALKLVAQARHNVFHRSEVNQWFATAAIHAAAMTVAMAEQMLRSRAIQHLGLPHDQTPTIPRPIPRLNQTVILIPNRF